MANDQLTRIADPTRSPFLSSWDVGHGFPRRYLPFTDRVSIMNGNLREQHSSLNVTVKHDAPDNEQPLDFSTKKITSHRDIIGTSSASFTPSPTPPEPPAQLMGQFLSAQESFMHMQSTPLLTSPPDKNHLNNGIQTSPTVPSLSSETLRTHQVGQGTLPTFGFGLPNLDIAATNGTDGLGTGLLTTLPSVAAYAFGEPRKTLKYTRPFKAYPRDPLNVPMGYYGLPVHPLTADAMAAQSLLATASDQAYIQFREQMMVTRRTHSDTRRPLQSKPQESETIQSTATSSAPVSCRDTVLNGHSHANGHIITEASFADSNGSSEEGNSSQYNDKNQDSDSSPNNNITNGQDNSPTSLKKRGRQLPIDLKDEAYWERRRKNNEAAKRSRDARRAKEDEIAIRAAFLEQENLRLRVEVATLKSETAKLRCLLYNS